VQQLIKVQEEDSAKPDAIICILGKTYKYLPMSDLILQSIQSLDL